MTTDNYFRQYPITNPILGIALFLVLVLNLLGHVARPSCNFALRVLKFLVTLFIKQEDGEMHRKDEKLLKEFPTDIRQVRQQFKVDPTVTIFATCPKCSYTHAPQPTKDPAVHAWPTKCQFPGRYKSSKPCGEQLTTHGVQDGKSVKVPIRPFAYQNFPSFVAGLLSRPGMEDVIDRAEQGGRPAEMKDIWDGCIMGELKGPDKRPFLEGPVDETRLVWSLSIDWFNPYQNKQAGKKASTGSILMACLNLPPSLRHKPENLYLAGIIPGPKEPVTDEINHFLRPLINDLLACWIQGTWYTRTHQHPHGRRVRSALGPLVADQLAARKVAGGVAVRATQLDPFHSKQQLKDLNNIEDRVSLTIASPMKNISSRKFLLKQTWVRRTNAEFRTAANEYKEAPTRTAAEGILKRTGARWSELLRLPYWDPTRFIVIDPMHNLFLGLIQYHIRVVLQLGKAEAEQAQSKATPKQMTTARKVWSDGNATVSQLGKLPNAALIGLCRENGVNLEERKGKLRKKDFIAALFVGLICFNTCSELTCKSNSREQTIRKMTLGGIIFQWRLQIYRLSI